MNEIIKIGLAADPAGLIRGFQQAEGAVQKFGVVLKGTINIAKAAGQAMSAMEAKIQSGFRKIGASGAGLIATFGGAALAAGSFQSKMLNVQTIAKMSSGEYNSMSKSILNMSSTMTQSANTIAEGLYDVVSSGFAGSEALMVTEAAALAASAGLTETSVSARAITATLNAYGMQASQAADVSDILFKTVDQGVLTFEELAMGMGDWVGMAAQAGVAADDAAASIAAMTLSGINGAEASTSLSRLLTEFIQPGEKLASTARSLGYESALAMLQTEGLEKTMVMLGDSTGGTVEGFMALFPEIRAARGALALAANDGENYARVAGVIADENQRAGATTAAQAVQMQGLGAQWQITKNQMAAVGIEVGTALVPALTLLTQLLQYVVGAFQAIPAPVKAVIAGFGLVAGLVMVLAGVFGLAILKSMAWGFAMRHVATLAAGAAAKSGILAGAMTAVGRAATFAAGSTGVMGTAVRGLGVAAGATSTAMNMSKLSFIGFAGAALGLVAAVIAVKESQDAAAEAGREMAKAYRAELDTSTVEGMTVALRSMKEEAISARVEANNADGWKFWSNDAEKAAAYAAEMNSQQKDLQAQAENLREAMLSAFMMENVPDFDTSAMYPDMKKIPEMFSEVAGDLGVVEGDVVDRMTKIADAFDIDPSQHPKEFAEELAGALDTMNSGDANAQNMAQSLDELGEAAATTGERIEGLDKVMQDLLSDAFGEQEAIDNTQGAINDLYKSILDMKEAGTLGEAMRPDGFHEDALTLREDMIGLTEDYVAQSIEWAKSQENLTGGQFLANLQSQADAFRQAGKDAGLSAEYVEEFASVIEAAAENREIAIQFNESDLAAFEFVTEALIADLGLIPAEVETGMTIFKEDGEAALREYMATLRIVDDEKIENLISVYTNQALIDLQTFAAQRGLATEDVMTIISTMVKNPEQLDGVLAKLALTNQDYETLVGIVGAADSELLIAALETQLGNLTGEPWVPTVDANEDPAVTAINRVESELARINGTSATVTIFGNIRSGGTAPKINDLPGQSMDRSNANGNLYEAYASGGLRENHLATIAQSKGTTRIWNEDETGGEAYIPLAATKRRRSMHILGEVARRFKMGLVRKFAGGGITSDLPSRFREDTDTKTSSSGSGSRSGSSGSGSRSGSSSFSLDNLENQFEMGDLSIDQYLQNLQKLIKGYKKYSEEYMTIHKRIEALKKEANESERKQNQIMLELGEISEMTQLAYLDRKIAAEEKYTDEWWDLTQERMGLAEEMADRQKKVEKMMVDLGVISKNEYKVLLKSRLETLRKFSDEWYEVWQEIMSLEDGVAVSVEDAQKRYDQALEDQLEATEDHTKAMANAIEDYRREIENELRAARDAITEPILALGDVVQQFGGDLDVSRDEILEYYRHVTQGAQRFKGAMERLEAAGVSEGLLDQLYKAGPEALNVATAFEEMVASGQIHELEAMAAEIAAISDETGDFYMSTRGKSIVDAFGIEESVDWMGDFGVSLEYVNAKAETMAMKFEGVKSSLDRVAEAAKEVADALAELETAKASMNETAVAAASPVQELYRELFGREADAAGNAFWTNLYAGGMSIDAIRATMKNTPEYIKSLYQKLLGREVDAGGYQFWSSMMAQGVTGDQIEQMIMQTEEYKNRKAHGGLLQAGRAALVGENGPEIIRAPAGGALVYPTGHGGGAGGETVIFENIFIGANNQLTRRDVEEVVEASFYKVKRQMMTGSRR